MYYYLLLSRGVNGNWIYYFVCKMFCSWSEWTDWFLEEIQQAEHRALIFYHLLKVNMLAYACLFTHPRRTANTSHYQNFFRSCFMVPDGSPVITVLFISACFCFVLHYVPQLIAFLPVTSDSITDRSNKGEPKQGFQKLLAKPKTKTMN